MSRDLDARAILALHVGLARRYGGAPDLLDPARLSEALDAQDPTRRGAGGPVAAVADRAAALLAALCRAQAFADGNRRVAAAAAAYFLLRHGAFLLAPAEDLERLVGRAARGEASEEEIAEWLEANAFWPVPPRPEETRLRLPVTVQNPS